MNIPNAVLLSVNIDHVATLRQARKGSYPNPVLAAVFAEAGGADGITLHLREDRRHIQEYDVWSIKETLLTPMNLEMAITEDMLALAEKIKPAYCCFVPERREELTTEGGLNILAEKSKIKAACERLQDVGIKVSFFIDPDPKQIEAARECKANSIELHTGCYAVADKKNSQYELQRIVEGAKLGVSLGFKVNAGHGLDYQNVQPIAAIDGISELMIGYSIVSEALFYGIDIAVARMKNLIEKAHLP